MDCAPFTGPKDPLHCLQVRTVRVEKRINEIANRLNKTKVKPDLKGKNITVLVILV